MPHFTVCGAMMIALGALGDSGLVAFAAFFFASKPNEKSGKDGLFGCESCVSDLKTGCS